MSDSNTGDFSADDESEGYQPPADEEDSTDEEEVVEKSCIPKNRVTVIAPTFPVLQMADNELTADIVKDWVEKKILVPFQPKSRGFHWKYGMRRLLWADESMPLRNWFYCSVCKWTHKTILTHGTGALKGHATTHAKARTDISLSLEDFDRSLYNAALIGQKGYIDRNHFMPLLPRNGKW